MVGWYCAVVGCHNRQGRDDKRFFNVVRKDDAQTQAWIQAIHREEPDGSPWVPTKKTVICQDHFVGGTFSKDPTNPAYKPSIFPTNHAKAATEADMNRFQRVSMIDFQL